MMTHAPVVLGLDFGGTKIAAAVCGLAGNRLGSVTVSSAAELGARASFDRGIQAARDLLASTAPGAELAAVGVSTFGIPFDDRVELAPAIAGWDELPLGRELRAAFPGAEIRMATDAKAAALAEVRWGALAGCDPAIYLNLGTGLSAALVVGGQVIVGANGAAGEIGYCLRALSDVGLALEARLPLEDMVSGRAVARQAARLSAPGSRVLTAEEVFGASSDEPRLDRLVSEFVTELAFHVVNLAIALNPARIAVGGGMVGSWDRLRPGLAGALDAGTPFPPELVPARFPDDAPLRGAVALAVDAAAAIPARASAGDGDGDTAARRDSATRSDSPNGSQPPNRTHSDTDSGSTAGGVAPVPHRPGTLTERLQS
ncbi:MAG TPA: ROK family protein [Streptosporangiaceae bacterium]|jgi:glucokinase